MAGSIVSPVVLPAPPAHFSVPFDIVSRFRNRDRRPLDRRRLITVLSVGVSRHRLSPCPGRDKASLQSALPDGTFAHVRFGTKVRWPVRPGGSKISFPTQ